MPQRKHMRGPLVTLAAVALLGMALLLVNVSQQPGPTTPGRPVAESLTQPPPPPVQQFPAQADYVGEIQAAAGAITLEISVDGEKAIAYACDGSKVEVWLRGSASNGVVSLASKDKTSRLDGRLQGNAVVGSLSIDQKTSDFTAGEAQPPAGLYVDEDAGVRNSWIVDANGDVTGVQRGADGSTGPAPRLSGDAIRVEGDSDV
jgi:hypothetical protein